MNLLTKCVNAHDLCYQGGPCPYCEPIVPLRTEDGRFATVKMTKDQMLEDLKNPALQMVTVSFVKADGSLRIMDATLRPDLIPQKEEVVEEKKTRTPNPSTIRVFDLGKNEWRSFRVDSVVDWFPAYE